VNVLILGVQGSGKGTQATRIASEYGLAHVSTGDMLRAAVAAETELGLRVKPILESGRLVPDDLIIDLIRERVAGEDGFVLDGFPRTMAQAEALDEMLREEGRELDVVLELQVSDEVATSRLLRRAQDEGRSDDTPETIRTRVELYHRETEPLVEYYRAKGIVVGIHGERPVDAVFSEIQETLERVAA
jgi:adenylate kinase